MDSLSVKIDSKDTFGKIEKLVRKIKRPEPLLNMIGNYMRAQTRKMFTGRRPDNTSVRGEKWPKLTQSTIQNKLNRKLSGEIIGDPRRPLVATGKLKNSLLRKSAIKIDKSGLEYGTEQRSRRGFLYPALHETGGRKVRQRRWLFLNNQELLQIATTVKEWISGSMVKGIK